MENNKGQFRFTYFTKKYMETCTFYSSAMGFDLEHSWDRNDHDKGSVFKSGMGLIEIMQFPGDEVKKIEGLDYRPPQGAFMCIQVWNIDDIFKKYKANGISFKQEIVDQAWGHRSFSVLDPNGIILFFFQEQFDIEM